VLATLDGQVQLAFADDGQQTIHYRFGNIGARRGSDFLARDLASAAPNHHDVVRPQPGHGEKAAKSLGGVGC
jgi:hypothetical protein